MTCYFFCRKDDLKPIQFPTPPKRLERKMSNEKQMCQSLQNIDRRVSITPKESPMRAHQRSRSSSKGRTRKIVTNDEIQIPKRPPRRRQRSKDSSLIQSPTPSCNKKKKKSVRNKKSTIIAENVKRKIEDLNKRLDELDQTTDEESFISKQ